MTLAKNHQSLIGWQQYKTWSEHAGRANRNCSTQNHFSVAATCHMMGSNRQDTVPSPDKCHGHDIRITFRIRLLLLPISLSHVLPMFSGKMFHFHNVKKVVIFSHFHKFLHRSWFQLCDYKIQKEKCM